jgi:hypothetical protein
MPEKKKVLEVVQHEGWLLKRGEGFDDNPDKPPASRARGGSTVGSKIERMLKGSSERKRYFKLLTITDAEDKDSRTPSLQNSSVRLKTSSSSMGRAELRYFTKPDDSQCKGVIVISNECRLEMSVADTSLKLVTPGRTYFLRPEGDASSASAKTEAAQWADTLRREIRTMRALPHVRF